MQPPLFQRSSRFGYRRWRRSGWLLVRLAPDTPHKARFGIARSLLEGAGRVRNCKSLLPAGTGAAVYHAHSRRGATAGDAGCRLGRARSQMIQRIQNVFGRTLRHCDIAPWPSKAGDKTKPNGLLTEGRFSRDQIRAGDQPQDRQGAGPRSTSDSRADEVIE
jgi:hypothetical protein